LKSCQICRKTSDLWNT